MCDQHFDGQQAEANALDFTGHDFCAFRNSKTVQFPSCSHGVLQTLHSVLYVDMCYVCVQAYYLQGSVPLLGGWCAYTCRKYGHCIYLLP
jgi:hypothetical protein